MQLSYLNFLRLLKLSKQMLLKKKQTQQMSMGINKLRLRLLMLQLRFKKGHKSKHSEPNKFHHLLDSKRIHPQLRSKPILKFRLNLRRQLKTCRKCFLRVGRELWRNKSRTELKTSKMIKMNKMIKTIQINKITWTKSHQSRKVKMMMRIWLTESRPKQIT